MFDINGKIDTLELNIFIFNILLNSLLEPGSFFLDLLCVRKNFFGDGLVDKVVLCDVEVEILLVFVVLRELERKSFSFHGGGLNSFQGLLLHLIRLEDDLTVVEKLPSFGVEFNLVDISVDGKDITDLSRVNGIRFVFEIHFEEKSSGFLKEFELFLVDLGDNFHEFLFLLVVFEEFFHVELSNGLLDTRFIFELDHGTSQRSSTDLVGLERDLFDFPNLTKLNMEHRFSDEFIKVLDQN